jgi:CheY-like chemotaxis protein
LEPKTEPHEGSSPHIRGEVPVHVMVAEDNAINVMVMKTILEREGFLVTTAKNGEQVLSTLADRPVDLILMDVSMPEIDGVEATRRIRSGQVQGVSPEIPIIAITAHSMKGDREQFMAAGMNDYLAKPFGRHQVLDVIARVLEQGEHENGE